MLEFIHSTHPATLQDSKDMEEQWQVFSANFSATFEEETFSAASMQEYMMRYRSKPGEASKLENVKLMAKK